MMSKSNQDYLDKANSPADCDRLIANASRAGNSQLVLMSRKKKIVLLAAMHGATKEVEVQVWSGIYAIEEYRRSKGKRHWRSNRTRTAIDTRNGDIVSTVDDAVSRTTETDGFQEMIDAGLEQFLWERLVLSFPECFSERAIEQARARLDE